MKEADMTISGVVLSTAQSLTVRVALQQMAMTLRHNLNSVSEDDDDHGRALDKAYLERIAELNRLIALTAK